MNFPVEFHANMDWLDSFSLDTEALEGLSFPKLEVRWQFLVYGTMFPLSFTLMMLLFFNEFYVVVWYFIFLFSICMLGASFALIVMPRTSDKFFGNTPFPAENVCLPSPRSLAPAGQSLTRSVSTDALRRSIRLHYLPGCRIRVPADFGR